MFPKPTRNKKLVKNLNRLTWSKLRNKCDEAFSKLIRNRDNWTCVACNKSCKDNKQNLDCSHFYERGIMGTRFDPLNCDALCKYCHRLLENKKWHGVVVRGKLFNYLEWKKKQIGDSNFSILEFKSQSITKFSRSDLEIMLLDLNNQLKKYDDVLS